MTNTPVGAQHAAPLRTRRSIRLRGYDYAQGGAYFVTICAWGRECIFGKIANGDMRVNAWGRIVQACWDDMPNHYGQMVADAFVVMPNHVHGIIVITDGDNDAVVRRGAACCAPTSAPLRADLRANRSISYNVSRGSLGAMVRSFKSVVTKRINELRGAPGVPVWQRNYYERIIRDPGEMARIREYIALNPAHWATDENNPARRDGNGIVGAGLKPAPTNPVRNVTPWP